MPITFALQEPLPSLSHHENTKKIIGNWATQFVSPGGIPLAARRCISKLRKTRARGMSSLAVLQPRQAVSGNFQKFNRIRHKSEYTLQPSNKAWKHTIIVETQVKAPLTWIKAFPSSLAILSFDSKWPPLAYINSAPSRFLSHSQYLTEIRTPLSTSQFALQKPFSSLTITYLVVF